MSESLVKLNRFVIFLRWKFNLWQATTDSMETKPFFCCSRRWLGYRRKLRFSALIPTDPSLVWFCHGQENDCGGGIRWVGRRFKEWWSCDWFGWKACLQLGITALLSTSHGCYFDRTATEKKGEVLIQDFQRLHLQSYVDYQSFLLSRVGCSSHSHARVWITLTWRVLVTVTLVSGVPSREVL